MLKRVLGLIAGVIAITMTFVAATATAAVVNLHARPTRRLVAHEADRVLEGLFAGRITVERIGGLGLGGVEGVRVRARDPDGKQVLLVDGVRVRVHGLEAALSAIAGKGPIRVVVDLASVDHVDVAIDADASGKKLRVANAFAPKSPKPEKKERPAGRGVIVDVAYAELRHAWVHGAPPGAPPIDAELEALHGNVHVDPEATSGELRHLGFVTRGMPRGVDPRGAIAARARIPAKREIFAEGSLVGAIAGIPTTAVARLDGSRVDARLDVARASGEDLRPVVGEAIAPRAAAALHAEAHGLLPRVDAVAQLRLGRGTVDVDGTIVTGPSTDVRATVAARHLDAGELVTKAPVTDVGLDASAHVNLGAAPRGEIAIDTLPGTLDRQAVPPVHVRGGFAPDAGWAGLRILDADMPTEIAAAMTTEGGARVVDAVVRADVPDLERVPKLGRVARGSAHVRGRGRVNLASKELVARVELDAADLEQGGRRVGRVKARVDARGTTDAPLADAEVHASKLDLGILALDRADATARVGKRETIVITDPQVALARGPQIVRAGASHVTIGDGNLHADELTVDGFGQTLRAEVDRDPRELRVQIDAPGVDLAKVASFAGRRDVRSGLLAMNGDVILSRGDLQGQLHAGVERVAAARVEGASARLDARFFGETIDIDLQAALGQAGHAQLRTDGLVLGGPVIDPESWRRAKGRADVDADVALDRLAQLVPPEVLPLGEVGGELVVRGAAWRRGEHAPPRLHVTAYTRGLVMAGKVPEERPLAGTEVKGVAPWRSQDFDVQLDARIDPDADTNELAIRLHDRKGIVAALDVKALLPVGEMMAHPETARERLADVPITAKLVVPERKLTAMPSLAGVKNVGGSVKATLDLSGTPASPQVLLVASGSGVRAGWLPVQLATDGDVRLAYDGRSAKLDAKVRSQGHDVLALSSHLEASARDLVEGRVPDWEGGVRVDLQRFPLGSFHVLADRRVRGRASGHFVLEGLHRDARLDAALDVEDLRVGRARYTKGHVTAQADATRLVASARVEQTDGWLAARAEVPIAWGAAAVPSLAPNQPVRAQLGARSFRVAALSPFVQGPLNDLDGTLDADASLAVGGGADEVKGHLALRDGRLQVTALGEELHDLRANVVFQPDGSIAVNDVFARGTEGELNAKGTVRTNGLSFASADADIHIPKALPFALQGEPVGRLEGDVKMHAESKEERIAIAVDVPKMRAELPQSLKGGLQDMAPPTNIRAGVYRSRGEFVRLPLDREDVERWKEKEQEAEGQPVTPVDVDVKLGDITLVKGTMARVVVTGNPHVSIDEETRMSGQIRLKSGHIDVQGKQFEIDHGTVTFDPKEEPSNPTINATATWTAADGTKVFADFVGPVKTGKLNLRSEPPRPKNEILAMILFGTADGMNAAPPPPGRAPDGATKAAVAIGGGLAAQGLTEALDDLTGIEATARIDTTQSANPRPEVEVQIARTISVAFGHVLGNPPITEPDKNLVILDWRFLHAWSLETTFGDRGRATLDAIWQKRY